MWQSEYTWPFSFPHAADRKIPERQTAADHSWKPNRPLSEETEGTAAMLPIEVMA